MSDQKAEPDDRRSQLAGGDFPEAIRKGEHAISVNISTPRFGCFMECRKRTSPSPASHPPQRRPACDDDYQESEHLKSKSDDFSEIGAIDGTLSPVRHVLPGLLSYLRLTIRGEK